MNDKNYHDDLAHIRQMMEKSSRFISLSGLSGVFAGLSALLGCAYVFFVFNREGIDYLDIRSNRYTLPLVYELIVIGLVILVAAVLSGYFFTARNSKKKNLKIWDSTTRRLLVNFAIPLVTGGIFCLALIYHQLYVFVAPATLIFYGLALVSAAKYTHSDVQNLGYLEIALGLVSLFVLGWGLLFWGVGFGILHIVYGLLMYRKYE